MKVAYIMIVFIFIGCNPNKYYNMSRQVYQSDMIELNGSYVSNIDSNGYYDQLIFYKDGKMFFGSGSNNSAFDDFENTNKWLKKSGGYLGVGIYHIQDDKIIIERNIATKGLPIRRTKMSAIGKILNERTIVTDIYAGIDTYKFVKHYEKPDSTLFKFVPDLED